MLKAEFPCMFHGVLGEQDIWEYYTKRKKEGIYILSLGKVNLQKKKKMLNKFLYCRTFESLIWI